MAQVVKVKESFHEGFHNGSIVVVSLPLQLFPEHFVMLNVM